MNKHERRSDWLVIVGIGLVLWGSWWLLNGFLAPLLWPLAAVLDAVSRVGWPIAIIALGILVIITARRGGLPADKRGRRLYRSRTDRIIGGVLAGIADYFGWDPTIVRVVYAALAFFTSVIPAFVLYVIAMIVIPEEPIATVIDAQTGVAAPAPPIPSAPSAPPAPGAPTQPPAPPAPPAWPAEPPAPNPPASPE